MLNETTPVRCLIIQLGKTSDILQSLMALRAVKQLYPAMEIHFVVRERFASAVKHVVWIEKVIILPTDALLGPIFNGTHSEDETIEDLAAWAGQFAHISWDFVVNWTYSQASSFLTAILSTKVKLGYSRHSDMAISAIDGWSHYIQAIIQNQIPQSIHLTDILTTQLLTALQIHVGDPANAGDSPVTSKTFFSIPVTDNTAYSESRKTWSERDSGRKWIAIQLGSLRKEKNWNASSWAKLTVNILKHHPECRFVLLGNEYNRPQEVEFMEVFAKLNPEADQVEASKVIPLTGKTDFELWSEIIASCRWVFSGDTAAISLASLLGTRILNISVGPVRWFETGPYGNGHYVLRTEAPCEGCLAHEKPENAKQQIMSHTCGEISPEAAYATWSYASSEWAHRRALSFEEHCSCLKLAESSESIAEHLKRVQVFRSKVRLVQDGGGVYYEPLLDRPMDIKEWVSIVIDQIARAWYCGWIPPVGQGISRERITPTLIHQLRTMEESANLIVRICEKAGRVATVLENKSARLKSDRLMGAQKKVELQALAADLIELDGLIERLGNMHEPLRAFSNILKVLMHNLSGSTLTDLGRESRLCYKQLHEGTTIFRDWLKFTLGLAKPVAIRTGLELV